jgi:hypothetical protein
MFHVVVSIHKPAPMETGCTARELAEREGALYAQVELSGSCRVDKLTASGGDAGRAAGGLGLS